MPKIREIIQPPPEPEGGAEEQIAALREYLTKITQELYYLLTHLESDNINDVTFERINAMIPRPYIGLPMMDGPAYAGGSANWARGDHRHPSDNTKVDKTRRINGKPLAYDVFLLKHDVGLGNVDNVKQAPITRKINGYSLENDVTLDYSDVGAVPISREINGHALSDDVTLTYSDVGARPDTWTPSASDVGAIPATDKGSAGGVAELDSGGKVPAAQLPSYVDDVLEYASQTAFPATGETGKIYVALDTNRTYRWSGSAYVEISASLALGETSSTAYRGDRGKTAYDHSQTTGNPHGTTAAEVGARPDTWTPSASDVGAQPTITANGILKGDGLGGVSAATAGTDYQTPLVAGTDYQTPLTAGTDYQTPLTAGTDYATPAMIPSVPAPSDAAPQALGTAAAGSSGDYSRADHVHKMPSAADVGAYVKPSSGIPSSDMASAVQTSLGKADSAYQKPSGGIPASDLANGVIPSVPSASDASPQDLASSAAAGTSTNYSRADHAHKLPSAADVGALAGDGILFFPSQAVSAGTAQQILSISNATITSDYVLGRIEFANPAYITAQGSWTTAAGSFTLTGTATAATTANVLLIRKGN